MASQTSSPWPPLVVECIDRLAGGADWPARGLVFSTNQRTPISGFSKAKNRVDEKMRALLGTELKPWRTHDLRRTVATGLQRLGVRFEVTEAVLNHVSGSKSGVAGVYQRHDWKEEKRSALEGWGRHVEGLLRRGTKGEVIPLIRSIG
jgi:integrase